MAERGYTTKLHRLLIKEHRLIEKMIEIIKQKEAKIQNKKEPDLAFINSAVYFIKMYADKTHHGKEEDIFFHDCAGKNMSEHDTNLMKELIQEHKFVRETTNELTKAKEKYQKDMDNFKTVIEKLHTLTEFYPQHITKDDKLFFRNSEKYCTDEQLQQKLEEFWQFDKNMIHEKYQSVAENVRKGV